MMDQPAAQVSKAFAGPTKESRKAAKSEASEGKWLAEALVKYRGVRPESPRCRHRTPPLSRELPLVTGPCVYFLSLLGRVVYVGQSRALWLRLREHRHKEFDSVRYLPVEQRIVDVAEQAFIAYYEPALNKTIIDYRREHHHFLLTQELDDPGRMRVLRQWLPRWEPPVRGVPQKRYALATTSDGGAR